MPQLGFELTTPLLERVKAVHASHRLATVIERMNIVTQGKCFVGAAVLPSVFTPRRWRRSV
jgi:hypothetical protein